MSLYVLVLRGADGMPDEVRYHDRPLEVGHLVRLSGRDWFVASGEDVDGRVLDPSGAEISAHYICHRADGT